MTPDGVTSALWKSQTEEIVEFMMLTRAGVHGLLAPIMIPSNEGSIFAVLILVIQPLGRIGHPYAAERSRPIAGEVSTWHRIGRSACMSVIIDIVM